MPPISDLPQRRPFVFVVALFVLESGLPLPFAITFNVMGLDLVPLRLIIPAAQSLLMICVIWYFGWFARAGFTSSVRNVYVYWYPVLLAFVPVVLYGSIAISAEWILFYFLALLFTGISEEALARGIMLPVLLPNGKWIALFFAAVLFSVGHFSNLFFEDFSAVEMARQLLSTFGFAVLYGGVFLKTDNIWPLIVLHTVHDYAFLTSGTAGPFVTEPISAELSIGLSLVNIAYGVAVAKRL